MTDEATTCRTCMANRGELIPPGGTIHEDALWRIEHILEPLPMAGWLIAKPRRHVTSFSGLTEAEAAAFGPLMRRTLAALERAVGAEKVYLCLFAEAEGFVHIHVHLIPAMKEWAKEQRGPAVFDLIGEAMRRGNLVEPALAERIADEVRAALEGVRDG